MSLRRVCLWMGMIAALESGCAPADTSGAGGTADTTSSAASGLTVVTDKFDVPAGDVFDCYYTGVVTKEELSVWRISGKQGPGGHHITVYTTDQTKNGHTPCTDQEMTSWTMIGGADVPNSGEPVISLPEGFAYKVAAGKQIALQIHYINTTGETYSTQDEVTLSTIDPAKVDSYVNLFTVVDLSVNLPANAATTRVSSATIKQDVQLFWLGGHMHELGTHYTAEMVDGTGKTDVFYDHDWSAAFSSHPPTDVFSRDAPFVIKAGTTIRQTCQWNNNTPNDVVFPREMCVMFGFYFPDNGNEIIYNAHLQKP
ncbi:MAG: hypothetical protein U0441_24370 [Polyangiaceae bacterium]